MNTTWLAVAAILAGFDWLAVFIAKNHWRWLTKTGTMLCLITAYTLSGGWEISGWFGVGLMFSLAGDAFLLLPPRFFLAGLAAFLLAQLTYIVAFNDPAGPVLLHNFLSAGILLTFAYAAFRRFSAALPAENRRKTLRRAIAFYILAISAMVYSASTTLWNPAWQFPANWLALLGALFFYFSDWTLANQRFIRSTRSGRVMIMVTYHLAQFLLVLAFLLRQ